MKKVKPEHQVYAEGPQQSAIRQSTSSSSSSRWEAPISDTQVVNISDYLLTEQETRIFLAEEGQMQQVESAEEGQAQQEARTQASNQAAPHEPPEGQTYSEDDDSGVPSWEVELPHRLFSKEFPVNTYGESADRCDMYWQTWLDEVAIGADELDRIPMYKHLYGPSGNRI